MWCRILNGPLTFLCCLMLAVHFLEAIVPKATTPHCGGLKAPPKVRGDVTRAVRVNTRCVALTRVSAVWSYYPAGPAIA